MNFASSAPSRALFCASAFSVFALSFFMGGCVKRQYNKGQSGIKMHNGSPLSSSMQMKVSALLSSFTNANGDTVDEKCSGVVLCNGFTGSEGWILTAAHCHVSPSTTVKFGPSRGNPLFTCETKDGFIHEDYASKNKGSFHDLGLVKFSCRENHAKLSCSNFAKSIPTVPVPLQMAGFGRDDSGYADTGYEGEGEYGGEIEDTGAPAYLYVETPNAYADGGDSGSAVFWNDEIIGISSRANRQGLYTTNVVKSGDRDWIDEHLSK